ncbi:MAG: hypothetical protein ACOCWR_02835 [Oceanidesulfovibrio sp.]
MKRVSATTLLLLAGLCLLFVQPAAAADKEWIEAHGYVLYQDERGDMVQKKFTAYRDVFFPKKTKQIGYFLCEYERIISQVPVKDIRYIRKDPLSKSIWISTNGKEYHAVISQDLAYALTNMKHVEMRYFNEITQKEEIGFILGIDLHEIHFTDTSKVGY